MTGGARKLTIKSALVVKDTREAGGLSIGGLRKRRQMLIRFFPSQEVTEPAKISIDGEPASAGDLPENVAPLFRPDLVCFGPVRLRR